MTADHATKLRPRKLDRYVRVCKLNMAFIANHFPEYGVYWSLVNTTIANLLSVDADASNLMGELLAGVQCSRISCLTLLDCSLITYFKA
jgi:hypothetical protein